MNVKHVIWASIMSTTISCQSVKKEYTSFEEYPTGRIPLRRRDDDDAY